MSGYFKHAFDIHAFEDDKTVYNKMKIDEPNENKLIVTTKVTLVQILSEIEQNNKRYKTITVKPKK